MNKLTKFSVSILLIITILFSPLIPAAPVFAGVFQDKQTQNLTGNLTAEQMEELAKAKQKKEEQVNSIKSVVYAQSIDVTMSEDDYLEYIYGGHTNAKNKTKEDKLKHDNLKEKLKKERNVIDGVYDRVYNSFPWDDDLYEHVKIKSIDTTSQIEASAQDPRSFYNTVVGPSEMNRVRNIKYSDYANTQETISPQTGDLTLQQIDAVLPGRNGLDLKLARVYSSNRALYGDYKVTANGAGYQDYSTYELNRYALGMGWSLAFPSVEVAYNEGRKELYYHTGLGGAYHVNFTTDPSDSNLENYDLKDAVFQEDSSYNNGQVQSKYVFIERNLTKNYFAEDGRLLAIKDNLGNEIKFNHTEQQVGNMAPNWNFKYPETAGVWTNAGGYFTYDTSKGYSETNSLKFSSSLPQNIASYSKYIEIKPNDKYILNGFLYDSLSTGVLSIDAIFYDQYYNQLLDADNAVATTKNAWQFVETSYIAPANAAFVRLRFVADSSATGSGWLDNIRFSAANPLISKITDTIGREVTFTYQESVYKNNQTPNMISMKIFDPGKTTSREWNFYRSDWYTLYNWRGDYTFQEEKHYLSLAQAYDPLYNGEIYTYNTNWNEIETKYIYWKKVIDSDAGWGSPQLISRVDYPHSYTNYTYERVTRNLGASGLIEVNRVKSRYDQLKSDLGPQGIYQRNVYTYTNDTSGWPSYSDPSLDVPSFTCSSTATTDQGRTITTTFKGLKGQKQFKTEDTNAAGEKRITESEIFDTRFNQLPTRVRLDYKNALGATRTLYKDMTYTDWGDIATETYPITLDQLTNSKNLYTISYSYEPNFKQKTAKTYYQNPGHLLTETTEYDSLGRVRFRTDAKGQKSEYIYDLADPNKLIESREYYSYPNSYAKTTYEYLSAQDIKPTKVIQTYTDSYSGTPVQKTSVDIFEYDPLWGDITKHTDPEGRTTQYSYDTIGRKLQEKYPSYSDENGVVHNTQLNYNYYTTQLLPDPTPSPDWNGMRVFRVSSSINDNGLIYSAIDQYYDGFGNLLQTRTQNALEGPVLTHNHFNSYNQPDWSQDAKGNRSLYTFDSWDRLSQVKDSQNNTYNFAYDEIANTIKKAFIPNGGTEQNQYLEALDQWNRMLYQETYPVAGKTIRNKYEYDLAGNMVSFTSPKYLNTTIKTQYEYDELNQLVKVMNAKGEVTQYDYDRLGGLKTQTEGAPYPPVTKTWLYDERGLVTEKKDQANRSTRFNFNTARQTIETVDRNGLKTGFAYDGLGRLRQMNMGSDHFQYFYNPVGTTLIKDYSDITGNRDSLSFSYSTSGYLKSRTYGTLNVSYTYDNNGNLTNIAGSQPLSTQYNYDSLNRVFTATTTDGKQITYDYYPNGLIKSKTFPALADGSALTVEYTYDNAMRLDTLTNKKGTTILSAFDYDYDDNDNVVAITSNGQRTDYVYDELDRLTEIRKPGQPTIVYQYDTRGNRKQVQGQEVPVTSQVEYQYDARNQLIQAQRDGQITKFSYEPTGMRAKKESATGAEKYVYDQQNRIVAITDGTNNVKFQIVWGPEAPLLLKDVATGKSYYYVLNGRGDVLQLIDEQGTIVNNYTYDEWGNILNKGEGVKNILRYASEPFDDETGLYYLRARYYDPEMGRFINEDTFEGDIFNSLSLNLYTFVINNPLKFIDPSGHIFTNWDDKRVTDRHDRDAIIAATTAWEKAYKANDKAGMDKAHADAEKVREQYRTFNEIGRDDGYTIDAFTGNVTGEGNGKNTVSKYPGLTAKDGVKIRQDIVNGLKSTPEAFVKLAKDPGTKQALKDSVFVIIDAHVGIVTSTVMDATGLSSGNPDLDKALEQKGYITFLSPSNLKDIDDLFKKGKSYYKKAKQRIIEWFK